MCLLHSYILPGRVLSTVFIKMPVCSDRADEEWNCMVGSFQVIQTVIMSQTRYSRKSVPCMRAAIIRLFTGAFRDNDNHCS